MNTSDPRCSRINRMSTLCRNVDSHRRAVFLVFLLLLQVWSMPSLIVLHAISGVACNLSMLSSAPFDPHSPTAGYRSDRVVTWDIGSWWWLYGPQWCSQVVCRLSATGTHLLSCSQIIMLQFASSQRKGALRLMGEQSKSGVQQHRWGSN